MQLITREAAKASGLKHYFTGEPCTHGHIDKRYVTTRICVPCGRDWNRETRRGFDVLTKRERYAREFEWRNTNRDRLARESRDWYHANTERGKQRASKRRALKRLVFVENVDPRVVFERDKGMCGICMKPVDPSSKWEIDHIYPISKGGEHSYANSQLSHRLCNRSKCNRIVEKAS